MLLELLGLVVASIAAILAYLALLPKRLYWASVTEVMGVTDRLSIVFDGRPLENVCFTKVAVWNGGRQSIGAPEISTADPLRILFDEGTEILLTRVELQTGNGVAAELKEIPAACDLAMVFDVLNSKDGWVASIVHTGSEVSRPRLTGTIRDVSKIIRYRTRLEGRAWVEWATTFAVAILLQISALGVTRIGRVMDFDTQTISSVIGVIVLVALSGYFIYLNWSLRNIPKKLNSVLFSARAFSYLRH